MEDVLSSNKRIAKNTLFLYFRQILILLVGLYTVRVVLNVLGVEDYGIYGVVAGIVSFFSFLSGSMASATQRFFSFALGKQDQDLLNRTFSINLIIYVCIAIVAIILLETIGLWFVYNKLNVPDVRFGAACYIFHFSVLTFLATIITSPFMAMIIAHEDMHVYAYVSIVEALLKLGAVFSLQLLVGDKLEIYGVLLFVVAMVNILMYGGYCLCHYDECQLKKIFWDKKLFKETINFTGWTLFGQLTTIFKNQAITIAVNQFFNPVIVAARTIATKLSGYINVFASNFNTSLYPSIIKEYAADNKKEMYSLIFNGSKITFFLLWIFALPLLLEMEYILGLWLKEVPQYAVIFSQLALIEVVVNAAALPLATAARAPGKMKRYELTLGSIQIIGFFVVLGLLYQDCPPYIVYVVTIAENVVMFIIRLFLVRYLIQIPLFAYIRKVLVPILIVVILSFCGSFIFDARCPETMIGVSITVLFSFFYTIGLVLFVAFDKNTRKNIVVVVKKKLKLCQ